MKEQLHFFEGGEEQVKAPRSEEKCSEKTFVPFYL